MVDAYAPILLIRGYLQLTTKAVALSVSTCSVTFIDADRRHFRTTRAAAGHHRRGGADSRQSRQRFLPVGKITLRGHQVFAEKTRSAIHSFYVFGGRRPNIDRDGKSRGRFRG